MRQGIAGDVGPVEELKHPLVAIIAFHPEAEPGGEGIERLLRGKLGYPAIGSVFVEPGDAYRPGNQPRAAKPKGHAGSIGSLAIAHRGG